MHRRSNATVIADPSTSPVRASGRLSSRLGTILEAVVVVLMGSLALLVILGVTFRKLGAALVFYDELASILLAWLTFYGAALAAYEGAHIGFPGRVRRAPRRLRLAVLAVREGAVFTFCLLLIWGGVRVIQVLEGTHLVSLPSVPAGLAQSAVPIGAALFALVELLGLRDRWIAARDASEPGR